MAIPVEVPKLGNTVEDCLISRWAKHKGDTVSAGELVAEIETDKATFEVTAPAAGTVLATFFEEGALVPVFTNLFVIGNPGEDAEAFRPRTAAAEKAGPAATAEAAPERPDTAAPVARAAASGPLSPRARRFAEEHNLHAAAVAGSGPGGRVLEEDLRRLYYSDPAVAPVRLAVPATTAPAAPVAVAAPAAPATAPRPSGIRDKIARRMRESLATTAQYTLNASAEATGLLALRAKIKTAGAADININDLVAFCTIKALLDVPDVNAEYIDGKIHKHAEVHLGFACDTPRGLLVPVVRNAQALTAAELAGKSRKLAEQAVAGTISPDDLSGATFTVSNLGGLGIESFTPLLNPPQVAILGVGGIQLKPVRRTGAVEFVDFIGLSLTCDHQVIDGAPGARFLKVVREKIENVERLCTI